MTEQDGVKAGKILKPYGFSGEVTMVLYPESGMTIKEGIPLFIELDGQRVPFFIESCQFIPGGQAMIHFEFVQTMEDARKIAGCIVYLEPGIPCTTGNREEELAQLVGYDVYDRTLGFLGMINGFVPQYMNPVWLIDCKGSELMVPATRSYIRKIDRRNRELYLELPDGITRL
jgi:16S rRNA processing protein RimM